MGQLRRKGHLVALEHTQAQVVLTVRDESVDLTVEERPVVLQQSDLTIVTGADPNLFIGSDPPTTDEPVYLWIQTGLGAGGTDMTFWVEDGS